MPRIIREFMRLGDRYYWQTAILIAQNMLAKQYRNSFLGMFWMLLQPLSMVIVYTMIMPMIMRFPIGNYTLFIVSSLPLWAFLSISLNSAAASLIAQSEVLKRCTVSSSLFTVADVLKNTYTYLITFATMYVFVAVVVGEFHWTVLLVPLYLIPIVFAIMAACIGVAYLAPYLRDIGELITVALNVLMWFTPVVYPLSAVPEWVQKILVWNPFFILLHPVQQLAYEGVIPSTLDHVKLLGVLLLAVAFGYTIYRKCRRNFVYYL